MNKPIFRWTVGDISNQGIDILTESVKNAQIIYNPHCIICYNNINIDKLKHIHVDLINQHDYQHDLAIPPKDELWKMFPARIDPTTHELFIDNDLVVFKRLQKIDDFLQSADVTLLLHGHSRYFGQYENEVPAHLKVNTGIFGIPPHFDLKEKIQKYFRGQWCQNREKGLFDDQGIITLCLIEAPQTIFITENEIFNYDYNFRKTYPPGVSGLHFINANRAAHPGWTNYKQKITKIF